MAQVEDRVDTGYLETSKTKETNRRIGLFTVLYNAANSEYIYELFYDRPKQTNKAIREQLAVKDHNGQVAVDVLTGNSEYSFIIGAVSWTADAKSKTTKYLGIGPQAIEQITVFESGVIEGGVTIQREELFLGADGDFYTLDEADFNNQTGIMRSGLLKSMDPEKLTTLIQKRMVELDRIHRDTQV